ncbi:MAG: hypothetical protein Kow0068_09470 [Marinilabiliales bacterium]
MILLVELCFNQNLVPNPSFEDTLCSPWGTSLLICCAGWTDYMFSPDFFTPGGDSVVSVPDNLFGYQEPATGNCYASFIAYSNIGFYREVLGIELITPLEAGKKYYVFLR